MLEHLSRYLALQAEMIGCGVVQAANWAIPVIQRVDFSANASIYDRRHGTVLALGKARELAAMGEFQPGAGPPDPPRWLADLPCEIDRSDQRDCNSQRPP